MPIYTPSGYAPTNALAYGGMDPASYDAILAANTAARARTTTTANGQTFTTSDPNYSLNQYVQDTQQGNAFRKPDSVQDFATANGTPLSANALHDYTHNYNAYWDSQHPNLQGIGGWMHNHPVGTIAAFVAAAAGGAAATGAFGGGAAGGSGAAGAGGAGATGAGAAGAGGAAVGGGSAAGGGAGLGIFSNGGAAGLAGVGGGNAGALAASGGIAGGAGIGGTTAGALGGFSGLANGVSGVGSGGGAGAGGSMGWGDWVNLAGSLYGNYAQGQGAKNASRAEQAAAAAGIAEQRRQFDLSRGDQMPWLQSGTQALGRLNDPNAFQQSPGYQFTRDEAFRDIGNQFSARGGAQSGNALRALQDRGAQLGSLEYNNWFNQQSNMAGLGQSSAQSLGALGQNNANSTSNLLGQQGNARASGIAGQTNALTGGISDLLSWYNRRNPSGTGGGGGGGSYNPGYGGGWN